MDRVFATTKRLFVPLLLLAVLLAGLVALVGAAAAAQAAGAPAAGAAGYAGAGAQPLAEGPALVAGGAHWSLVNLLCLLFCLAASVAMIVLLLLAGMRRGKQEADESPVPELPLDSQNTEETPPARSRAGYAWRVLSVVVALGAASAFLLNENLRMPMTLVCDWSPLMLTFAVAQVLNVLGLRQMLRVPAEELFDEEALADG